MGRPKNTEEKVLITKKFKRGIVEFFGGKKDFVYNLEKFAEDKSGIKNHD
jgi:hypothetical protein